MAATNPLMKGWREFLVRCTIMDISFLNLSLQDSIDGLTFLKCLLFLSFHKLQEAYKKISINIGLFHTVLASLIQFRRSPLVVQWMFKVSQQAKLK